MELLKYAIINWWLEYRKWDICIRLYIGLQRIATNRLHYKLIKKGTGSNTSTHKSAKKKVIRYYLQHIHAKQSPRRGQHRWHFKGKNSSDCGTFQISNWQDKSWWNTSHISQTTQNDTNSSTITFDTVIANKILNSTCTQLEILWLLINYNWRRSCFIVSLQQVLDAHRLNCYRSALKAAFGAANHL